MCNVKRDQQEKLPMYRTLQGLGICIFLTTEDKEKGLSDEEIVLRENTRLYVKK